LIDLARSCNKGKKPRYNTLYNGFGLLKDDEYDGRADLRASTVVIYDLLFRILEPNSKAKTTNFSDLPHLAIILNHFQHSFGLHAKKETKTSNLSDRPLPTIILNHSQHSFKLHAKEIEPAVRKLSKSKTRSCLLQYIAKLENNDDYQNTLKAFSSEIYTYHEQHFNNTLKVLNEKFQTQSSPVLKEILKKIQGLITLKNKEPDEALKMVLTELKLIRKKLADNLKILGVDKTEKDKLEIKKFVPF